MLGKAFLLSESWFFHLKNKGVWTEWSLRSTLPAVNSIILQYFFFGIEGFGFLFFSIFTEDNSYKEKRGGDMILEKKINVFSESFFSPYKFYISVCFLLPLLSKLWFTLDIFTFWRSLYKLGTLLFATFAIIVIADISCFTFKNWVGIHRTRKLAISSV